MPSRRVYIYLRDRVPRTDWTGPSSRAFSNARAYLDLGYDVHIVILQSKGLIERGAVGELRNATWHSIELAEKKSPFRRIGAGRLASVVGWPLRLAIGYQFPMQRAIARVARTMEEMSPGAIHHFEYLSTGCAIPLLPRLRCIWACNDIESRYNLALKSSRSRFANLPIARSTRRSIRYTRKAEILVAQRSRLTIAIADHERELIRRGWKCNRVDVVPMSVSSETVPVRSRRWVEDGALKLLHLGATHSLASFSSLEFLLRDVWPLLPASSWATVSLAVAGAMGDDELTTRIKQLAAPFPNVLLIGYQADLARLYSDADVQVIGTTRATGLRTRIVESFAYGLPVLSTAAGAKGIEGLRSGENILIGQSPSDFAEQILSLVHAPYRLARIAARARATYVSRFSRSVVARRLEVLLDRYVLSDG